MFVPVMILVTSVFFAPLDAYQPAGMFTPQHLVALLCCLLLVSLFLIKSKQMSQETLMKLTKGMAFLITTLELIKISYNFYYGYTWLDAWFPLSYCSLFIYALWFSGYGKGHVKKIGDAYIGIGCLLGGLGFLFVPTTSLMRYPIWHFLSLYSLLFHTIMVYFGVMYLRQQKVTINRQSILYFTSFFLSFALISISINGLAGSNLMILREPYQVPFQWVRVLQQNSQVSYTILAMLLYLVGPISGSWIVSQILMKRDFLKINKQITRID